VSDASITGFFISLLDQSLRYDIANNNWAQMINEISANPNMTAERKNADIQALKQAGLTGGGPLC
jgi:hypothetical protein